MNPIDRLVSRADGARQRQPCEQQNEHGHDDADVQQEPVIQCCAWNGDRCHTH